MMSEIRNGFTGITLNNIGKKFRDQWIFRNVSLEISKGEKIAITGHNGSGKSTFLQLLSGYISQSEGTITWLGTENPIPAEDIHHHLSLASPYLELIEEFTLEENVIFYSRYKKIQKNISTPLLMEKAGLADARLKQVKNFSSGMKQRCKLALAFMADTPLLLIDEPLSNLDAAGYEWYRNMIDGLDEDRTVILCSNQVKEETYFCNRVVNIENFK
jgi:ABC-type multidrug transport system ATPase subunit